ncbi:MAG: AsmA family protein [Rhodospirillales bacterium]|nr:AsmA family protein [Rhodospirillales bacterium]MBT4006239.1 AsmA family protein [Rhodospirillales bacterium]MBT5076728.1 AsmA family protein [Rhodospirillales bacterium]MBT5113183.1 AsmA family protein [Rhodospirillales bacterium]MBT5673059.1 AsmA family protein [Rhodospirillales bacterium]
MKKFLISVGIAFLVLIAGALVAPSFVDWNAYRAEITSQVRKATGRRLVIEGHIKLAVLPALKLSVTNVRLANLDGAKTADMAKLAALDVHLALWPLLEGKVVAHSVVLRGAEIELEHLADGRVNWDFPGLTASSNEPPNFQGEGSGAPGGDAIRLDRVTIKGGRLTYRDSRKRTVERIDAIDIQIAAATLTGPYTVKGSVRYHGVPLDFDLSTGKFVGSNPVAATLAMGIGKSKVKFSGSIAEVQKKASVRGKLELSGPDFSALVSKLARTGGGDFDGHPFIARKFTLNAALTGRAHEFSINDMALDLDGLRVTGAVAGTLGAVPKFDVTLNLNRLDAAPWFKTASKKGNASAAPKSGDQPSKPFSLPEGFRVNLDAFVAGVSLNKGVLRNLSISARLNRGVLTLKKAKAQMPGSTTLSLSGKLFADRDQPHFEGRVRGKSDDFRAFARWLGGDLGAVAPGRLRRVKYRFDIGAAPKRVEIYNTDIRFDSSRLRGGMVVALRKRIGIGTRLELDKLDLDAYMGGKPGPGKTTPPSDQISLWPLSKGKSGPGVLSALGGIDANFRLRARRLTYRGMGLKNVVFDGALVKGNLNISKLKIANVAGATVAISGGIQNLDSKPAPDVRFKILAKKSERLLDLVGINLASSANLLSPLSLKGTVKDGSEKDMAFDLALAAGKINMGMKGAVDRSGILPRLGFDLNMNHPDFTNFVGLFDPGFLPAKRPKGPFSLTARVDGAGLDLKLAKLSARLGEARLRGKGSLGFIGGPRLVVDLSADDLVADHFLARDETSGATGDAKKNFPARRSKNPSRWSRTPLELGFLKQLNADIRIQAKSVSWRHWRVATPRIDATVDKGTFDLRRLSGKMAGGNFLMTASIAAPAKKGAATTARLDVDISPMNMKQAMFKMTDLDIKRGKVGFKLGLKSKGATEAALIEGLSGSGILEARDGALQGFNLSKVNAQLKSLDKPLSFLALASTAMAGGTTKFSSLKGNFKIKKGVIRSDDLTLVADGGTGQGKMVLNLPLWWIDTNANFRLSGNAKAPPFGIAIRGNLDAPARILKMNALQNWLSAQGAASVLRSLLKVRKKTQPKTAPQTQPATGTQPAPQPPATQPAPKADPRDLFLRGILDILKKQ